MKKISILTLVTSTFMIVGCTQPAPEEKPEMVDKNYKVNMVYHYGEDPGEEEIEEDFHYSDYWFLKNSSELNYDLALASARVGGTSYVNKKDHDGHKIKALLENAGFKNIQLNQYFSSGIQLDNSMGAIIGNKKIIDDNGKIYTLLAVLPRSAGYENEWMGNFVIGTSGYHEGFTLARDEILRFTKKYITENEIKGDIKLWSAGYSRGAACVNLFGGYLVDNSAYLSSDIKLEPSNLFVYTIGTPRAAIDGSAKADVLDVSGPRGGEYVDTNIPAYDYQGSGNINLNDNKYKCIHNFVAYGDYITKLPPTEWGFGRYGQTENINYGSPEMVSYLREYSEEAADIFAGGKTYLSETPIMNVDLENGQMVDTGEKSTPDATIQNRINELMNISGSRLGLVEHNYSNVLGSITALYGVLSNDFVKTLTSDIGAVIKTALLNYLQHVAELTNRSDKDTLANLLMDIMSLAGKRIENRATYTDQQFLTDFLDYLINDYQTSDVAVNRANNLAKLIPAPYNSVYTSLLNYAKEKHLAPKTVDALLSLIANYVYDNKDDTTVQNLINLVAGLIPTGMASLLTLITGVDYSEYTDETEKARVAIRDVFECFAIGSKDQTKSAKEVRYSTLNMVSSFVLAGKTSLVNLLLNGSYSDDETVIEKDAALLANTCEDILKMVLSGKTLLEGANDAIKDLINKCKTSRTTEYVNFLTSHPAEIRNILFAVLLKTGSTYDLSTDIKNVFNFVNVMMAIFPAHYHELYISYLKTTISK